MTTLLLVTFTIALAYALHQRPAAASSHSCAGARAGVRFYREATHRWQTQRDATPTRSDRGDRAEASPSCRYVRWAARRWQLRARVERSAFRTWLLAMLGSGSASGKWGCIHSHEAAWNDEGSPQWGGLQMDEGFQATYGPEFLRAYGDASRWPVWSQLVAAERAFHGYAGYGPRGFNPWPNTARMCGLR